MWIDRRRKRGRESVQGMCNLKFRRKRKVMWGDGKRKVMWGDDDDDDYNDDGGDEDCNRVKKQGKTE